MPKPWTVWITTNCGKFWKKWEYQTTWPASWEIYVQVRKQQLELDMEQQTGSKSGKEYIKAVYCHPSNLTYMQSTSWEMLDWKKHKLESRLPACAWSSPAFLMMYSAYKLNKQGDNIQPWCTPFPIWNSAPLQYSCLENPMDGGAWRATVHGVARVRLDLATKPPNHRHRYI